MDHILQKIRPGMVYEVNRSAIEALDRKIRSHESWAQRVDVYLEVNQHTSKELDCRVEKIRTTIKSEPFAIDFIGIDPYLEAYRRDAVNAPVLATYKRAAGSPPYPFGVGLFGKLARKLGTNWGTEYSLGEINSAAFDGTLLVFISHGGPDYHRGYRSGILIQSAFEQFSLQRYNIQ